MKVTVPTPDCCNEPAQSIEGPCLEGLSIWQSLDSVVDILNEQYAAIERVEALAEQLYADGHKSHIYIEIADKVRKALGGEAC